MNRALTIRALTVCSKIVSTSQSPRRRAAHSGVIPEGADLLALDQQVCFALAVAARNVIGLYRPLLEPMGLTHPQYLVMLALWERSPASLSDLAHRLSLESATLSPLIKRLESQGYVRRERDARDDRALAITLTDTGAALRAEAPNVPAGIVDTLGMSLADLVDLRDRLHVVIEAAQRAKGTHH